ncbi:RTA1-domain-containing protein [Xylariaceae sp. FL1272]|nr:RTA1-domain-containing protein [Xylariaceae sp. FL1272]
MDNDSGPFGPVVNGTMVVVFYQYRPNESAAYAFLSLFAIATLAHIVYFFSLRAWWFLPFILGGIAEVFGYYGRAWSHSSPDTVGPWILQNLLLLTAPPLMSATIYMTLPRLTAAVDIRRKSLWMSRLLTPLYVVIDLGTVGTQLAGSVLPASGEPSAIELSKKLVLGGLLAQVVALTIFIIVAWFTQRRIAKDPPQPITVTNGSTVNWKNHFRAIQLVTLLVIVRSIVRTIEYLQGQDGFVISHEVFIYLFDAVPMFLIMTVYLGLHPGRLVKDVRSMGKGVRVGDDIPMT